MFRSEKWRTEPCYCEQAGTVHMRGHCKLFPKGVPTPFRGHDYPDTKQDKKLTELEERIVLLEGRMSVLVGRLDDPLDAEPTAKDATLEEMLRLASRECKGFFPYGDISICVAGGPNGDLPILSVYTVGKTIYIDVEAECSECHDAM